MSLGARLSIAVICMIAGVGFSYTAITYFDGNARRVSWAIAILCFLSVVSCFKGKHAAVTNRIIGAVIFFAYIAYLAGEIREGDWVCWSRAKPCVLSAIVGLIIWGLPAGYVMVAGRLPFNPFKESRYADETDLTELCDESRHYLRK